MTCRELADFLMEYVNGGLPPPRRRSFDEHLAACPNCVRYVAQYRQTIAAGRDAFGDPDAPLPDDVPAELVRAIVAARR